MERSHLYLFLLYLFLFVFGVLGNLIVIISVYRLIRIRGLAISASSHLRVYILALSIVDLCVLSVIPAILLDHWIIGQWKLGRAICKYYWAMENVSKLMSIALLAMLSLERYLTVRYPYRFRSTGSTVLLLLALVTFAVVALLPLLIFADVQAMTVQYLHRGSIHNLTVVKCAVNRGVSLQLQTIFSSYAFVLGYCIPFCVIIVAYYKLISYVKQSRTRAMSRRTRRMPELNSGPEFEQLVGAKPCGTAMSCLGSPWPRAKHINSSTATVVRVILFHLFCWTPYWLSILLPLFVIELNPTPTVVVALMYLHALPFASSAGNWVFYALLNRDLRLGLRSRRRKRRKAGVAKRPDALLLETININSIV